jgi:hypothetical protein
MMLKFDIEKERLAFDAWIIERGSGAAWTIRHPPHFQYCSLIEREWHGWLAAKRHSAHLAAFGEHVQRVGRGERRCMGWTAEQWDVARKWARDIGRDDSGDPFAQDRPWGDMNRFKGLQMYYDEIQSLGRVRRK